MATGHVRKNEVADAAALCHYVAFVGNNCLGGLASIIGPWNESDVLTLDIAGVGKGIYFAAAIVWPAMYRYHLPHVALIVGKGGDFARYNVAEDNFVVIFVIAWSALHSYFDRHNGATLPLLHLFWNERRRFCH